LNPDIAFHRFELLSGRQGRATADALAQELTDDGKIDHATIEQLPGSDRWVKSSPMTFQCLQVGEYVIQLFFIDLPFRKCRHRAETLADLEAHNELRQRFIVDRRP
jgi:hypothetical protein